MSFLEPSPIFLAFIFVQRFVFFEVLACLALIRLVVGAGASRAPALVTILICALAIWTSFAPAFNQQDMSFYAAMRHVMGWGGGIAMPLVASAVFATNLLIPTRRWPWIELAHLTGLLVFVILWIATRV